MQSAASPEGIPGGAVFLDHVHPTIEAHRQLGWALMRQMKERGWANPSEDADRADAVARAILDSLDAHTHASALVNLAKVLGWAGKYVEAERAARNAEKLAPDWAPAAFQAATMASLQGQTGEAVAGFRRALELKPDYGDAHCALGVLLENQGLLAEAEQHYTLALRHGRPDTRDRDQNNLRDLRAKRASATAGGP